MTEETDIFGKPIINKISNEFNDVKSLSCNFTPSSFDYNMRDFESIPLKISCSLFTKEDISDEDIRTIYDADDFDFVRVNKNIIKDTILMVGELLTDDIEGHRIDITLKNNTTCKIGNLYFPDIKNPEFNKKWLECE